MYKNVGTWSTVVSTSKEAFAFFLLSDASLTLFHPLWSSPTGRFVCDDATHSPSINIHFNETVPLDRFLQYIYLFSASLIRCDGLPKQRFPRASEWRFRSSTAMSRTSISYISSTNVLVVVYSSTGRSCCE